MRAHVPPIAETPTGVADASADPTAPTPDTARTALMGCPVDAVTMEDAVARIGTAMRLGRPMVHVALNTAKLIRMRHQPVLYRDVCSADLITADGMGIVLASRLVGTPLPERVTGVDLMHGLLEHCAQKGFRPYFLGGRAEVLEAALYRLQLRYPRLRIAGAHHGYFTQAEEAEVVAGINRARADCLFVALPTPQKERFIARHRAALKPTFLMGIGGTLDVVSGHVRRAPGWMQRCGLEWLYRTMQEPRRMWRRYLTTNAAFLVLLATASAHRLAGRSFSPMAKPPGPDENPGHP